MTTKSRQMGKNPLTFGQVSFPWRRVTATMNAQLAHGDDADSIQMFWENQFKTTIPIPAKSTRLQEQTAIITGANSGLGFECAKQMLGAGLSRLIVAVRSIEKGKAAAEQLQSQSKSASIEVWQLDMTDYDSIQVFARRCESELKQIDYVILNAGMSETTFTKVEKTGHETTIQVNYLSTVLLTILLLPILKAKVGQAHLTVVSSATTRQVKFPNRDCRPLLASFDDTAITPYDNQERYGISKLLGQLAFERIAGYVDPKDVVVTLVEPGWVKQTGLYRNLPFVIKMILQLVLAVCGRPVDQGMC